MFALEGKLTFPAWDKEILGGQPESFSPKHSNSREVRREGSRNRR